jgi:hypothetical protein
MKLIKINGVNKKNILVSIAVFLFLFLLVVSAENETPTLTEADTVAQPPTSTEAGTIAPSPTATETGTKSPDSSNQTITSKEVWGGSVAIFVVFFILISLGYLVDKKLNKGEMRRAIAGSFVVGFSILMFLSLRYDFSENQIITMYIQLAGIVIGFYFGSRAVGEKKEEEEKLEQISIENIQFSEQDKTINITIRNSGTKNVIVDMAYINNEPKQVQVLTIKPESIGNLSIKHEWEKEKEYNIKIATTKGKVTESIEKA